MAVDGLVPKMVAKMVRFTTSHSLKMKYFTGLLLVVLHPGKTLSGVSSIKYLL